jgi:hypothetical protein
MFSFKNLEDTFDKRLAFFYREIDRLEGLRKALAENQVNLDDKNLSFASIEHDINMLKILINHVTSQKREKI